jgi:hypothetical protein
MNSVFGKTVTNKDIKMKFKIYVFWDVIPTNRRLLLNFYKGVTRLHVTQSKRAVYIC